jgi:hypothetical protein
MLTFVQPIIQIAIVKWELSQRGHRNFAEAVQRPTMHFVAIKTPQQMDRAR